MGWTLVTSSWKAVDGWPAEAARLRSQLDAINACIADEYGEPLVWQSPTMTAEQWSDSQAITDEIMRVRIRDETPEQNLMPGAGARGVVQGYRDGFAKFMIASGWGVGGDGCQFNNVLNFSDRTPSEGHARKLNEHSPEWLVNLLCSAATAVDASEATIRYGDLEDELAEASEEAASRIGALTLLPNGIDGAELPDSITAHPCPVGYPDGIVLVADLDRVVNDYEALVPDLLRIHDTYRAQTDSND